MPERVSSGNSVNDLIGDYRHFFGSQRRRLAEAGVDLSGYPVSHIAYRAETTALYIKLRDELELHCSANVESLWKGRAISKLLLKKPLVLGEGFECELIELIPPPHNSLYKPGLEHTAIVIGDEVEAFCLQHRHALTGQPERGSLSGPYFTQFDGDGSIVKYVRHSLVEMVVRDGLRFEGFHRADAVPA